MFVLEPTEHQSEARVVAMLKGPLPHGGRAIIFHGVEMVIPEMVPVRRIEQDPHGGPRAEQRAVA